MYKILFSLIMMLVFFQKGLVSMENVNFSEKPFQTSGHDFPQGRENYPKRKITVYLAGKIPKGSEVSNDALHWTQRHMDHLRSSLDEFEVVLLNPAFKDCDLTDQDTVFGRDMHYVFSSDVIFVDARGSRGGSKAGIGAAPTTHTQRGRTGEQWEQDQKAA